MKIDPERVYVYTDATGKPLFKVEVYVDAATAKKSCPQSRYDPVSGQYISGMEGVALVPYNLPFLNAARYCAEQGRDVPTVYVVEGEKDCDTLGKQGKTATTNPQGAGKWRESYSPYLAGLHVVILPDNDEPGRQHAEQVAASVAPYAASVKIVRLWEIMPSLPEKGDVTDFLNLGGTMQQIEAAIEAAEPEQADAEEREEPATSGVLPFPVESFPAPLARLMREYAANTGLPAEFLGATFVAAASALVGRCVELCYNDYTATGTVWIALVAASGTGKTAPVAEGLRPLKKHDGKRYDDYRKARDAYDVVCRTTPQKEQPPPPPQPQQYVYSDATMEALYQIQAKAERGIILHRDEILGWIKAQNQYRDGADGENWLSFWSDEGISVSRKGDGLQRIDTPRISVIGGLQNSLLPRLAAADNLESGFFARLLFVMPHDPKPPRLTSTQTDFTAWNDTVTRLRETVRPQRSFDDTPEVLQARYTPDAWQAIQAHDAELYAAICDAQGDESPIAAALAKLRIYLHRFALIMQALRYGAGEVFTMTEIDANSTAAAVALCRYFRSTSEAALAVLNKSAADAMLKKSAVRLRENGLTYDKIAERLDVSTWQVRKSILGNPHNSHKRR